MILNEINIKKARKNLIETQGCVKHTFNDFILTLIAQGLIFFMKDHMHLKDNQIPNEVTIIQPVNMRPFYENFKYETIFGNYVGNYNITLPLNPQLSFVERLNIIKNRVDYCKSIHEAYYASGLLKHVYSKLSKKIYQWFLINATKIEPVLISGFKVYNKSEWKLLGCNLVNIVGAMTLSPGMPIGFAYSSQMDNKHISLSVCIDHNIAGNGASDLIMDSIQKVLDRIGVQMENNSINPSKL